jgi:D-3-phosphoglycerate dehydrogenase
MIPRAEGFGMPVVAWSRSLTRQTARDLGIGYCATLSELAGASDVVSVHVALNSDTRGLIGAEFFDAMRPGAYFINTSRAEVVDQVALGWAVRDRKIRAGLDVFEQEPAGGTDAFADPIVKLNSVYGTHHIGASTEQAQEAIAAETVRIVKTFSETGKVPNVVNLAKATPATCALVVRHRDRPGVLSSVLDAISAASINVQEMENIVFEGAEAAVARINLEREPAPELAASLRAANPNVLEISIVRLNGTR